MGDTEIDDGVGGRLIYLDDLLISVTPSSQPPPVQHTIWGSLGSLTPYTPRVGHVCLGHWIVVYSIYTTNKL